MKTSAFGDLLRVWRGAQGMSQLELSVAAGVSSRHVSFIETGRSRPSREMVLRLAETLALPLRHRNRLLVAAGFAPAYSQSPWEQPELGPVRHALELVLRSHEPFPAFVLDRGWDILLANEAHHRILDLLLPPGAPLAAPVNAIGLVLDPRLLRPVVANWPVVAHVLGHRLSRQLRTPDLDPRLRHHLEELLALPGVGQAMREVHPLVDSAVVIPLSFAIADRRLSWFSTIATLGTPQDVTLEELFVESLFPADEATDRMVRELLGGAPGSGRPPL